MDTTLPTRSQPASAKWIAGRVQTLLSHYYQPDTPVAIGYRVSWPDQWLTVVPLTAMAATSRERGLIRTTLYVVSPALAAGGDARSRLYSAEHSHLFRGGAEPNGTGRN